jgi:hypothetical protein
MNVRASTARGLCLLVWRADRFQTERDRLAKTLARASATASSAVTAKADTAPQMSVPSAKQAESIAGWVMLELATKSPIPTYSSLATQLAAWGYAVSQSRLKTATINAMQLPDEQGWRAALASDLQGDQKGWNGFTPNDMLAMITKAHRLGALRQHEWTPEEVIHCCYTGYAPTRSRAAGGGVVARPTLTGRSDWKPVRRTLQTLERVYARMPKERVPFASKVPCRVLERGHPSALICKLVGNLTSGKKRDRLPCEATIGKLQRAWHFFDGVERTGRVWFQVNVRSIRAFDWQEPVLSFTLVGGNGSQPECQCRLNLETLQAEVSLAAPSDTERNLDNVEQTVEKVVLAMCESKDEPFLVWSPCGKLVRVIVEKCVPTEAPRCAATRRRFRALLEQELRQRGWSRRQQYHFTAPDRQA